MSKLSKGTVKALEFILRTSNDLSNVAGVDQFRFNEELTEVFMTKFFLDQVRQNRTPQQASDALDQIEEKALTSAATIIEAQEQKGALH